MEEILIELKHDDDFWEFSYDDLKEIFEHANE